MTTTSNQLTSHILIFKTNIDSETATKRIASLINNDDRIRRWNIDHQDIDHVLRIESDKLSPDDVIAIIRATGYQCEELPE